MDSEARGATQSSVSSTHSSALLKGILLSVFIHASAFYGIYFLSIKVFEVINSREKVFRFTLLKDIPDEKKTALGPDGKYKKSAGIGAGSQEPAIKEVPQGNKDEASESSQETSVEGQDLSSRGVRELPVSYPRMSRILGEEGEVIFLIENQGQVLSFKKLKSSGFWRLDEAAEKVLLAKSENFLKTAFNQDVEKVRFVFKLKESQSM